MRLQSISVPRHASQDLCCDVSIYTDTNSAGISASRKPAGHLSLGLVAVSEGALATGHAYAAFRAFCDMKMKRRHGNMLSLCTAVVPLTVTSLWTTLRSFGLVKKIQSSWAARGHRKALQ